MILNTISPSVKFGLHFCGVWPGTPFHFLHKLCWVIAIITLQTYQYKYIVIHYNTDTLINIAENLSIAVPFSLMFIKLFVTWTNYGLFCDILSTMEEDCQKYANMDINNLITKTGLFSFYMTSMIMSSYLVAAVCYLAGAIAFQGTNDSMSRELLLKMDLPFETSKSPNYELVVTTQFIIHFSAALAFGTFTALLFMMILHLGCQIDIMCQNLTDVFPKNENKLKFFIIRYQEIITFAEKIEKLFTYIALSQLISNTVNTCCEGFLIVVAVNNESGLAIDILIKSILFYIVICLEVFIYCFAGEYLRTKSQLIGDTAYNMLWYDLRPNKSRLLIPVILRSQKGFTLTFGKFSNLSLESFTGIMKVSASYMSVLLALD
ncbi:odorant receptor 4-like isoform X2 [Bombus huntii]|uniref:odorant receptor 4-like isoform X2 n=2 Tax=Bombus huntii TaxID=85661 RepID=UPI0021AAC060|nr:odorant receptor 4-like isoform X2 [Bombus huntii]